MKVNKEELKEIRIDKDSIDRYIDFIELVKRTMEHPEYLGDLKRKDLVKLLNENSLIYLYQLGNIVIASSMIIPASKEELEEMGITTQDKVMELGPQAVFQDLRGNKIQQYMIDKMEHISKELGYLHTIATVHPDNKYSIKNIEEKGYHLLATKEFNRGIRNIYYKDI